jgi:hypothetical protein
MKRKLSIKLVEHIQDVGNWPPTAFGGRRKTGDVNVDHCRLPIAIDNLGSLRNCRRQSLTRLERPAFHLALIQSSKLERRPRLFPSLLPILIPPSFAGLWLRKAGRRNYLLCWWRSVDYSYVGMSFMYVYGFRLIQYLAQYNISRTRNHRSIKMLMVKRRETSKCGERAVFFP